MCKKNKGMNCPKCNSTEYIKSGNAKGKQRYKCKSCNYMYTVQLKSTAKSSEIKRIALEMYLEGLGFNSIARILKVSHLAVQKWINKFGNQLDDLKSDSEIKFIEMDELHTYIGQKKTIVGFGLLLIDMGKDSSTSFWVPGEQKRVKGFGKK